jgi:predicted nucleotidyltransferase
MTSTLLSGIVGSHAYGLAHEGSDIDRMGVFAAPTLEVAGLHWNSSKESRVQQGPEGDDFSEHEVGKFFKLVLKCNPTVSELLWLEKSGYEVLTDEGHELRKLRERVLSRRAVWASYHGYAEAQLRKYKDGFTKVKHARHALRLIEQGKRLYTTGFLHVKVQNPDRYFDLAHMAPETVLDLLYAELDSWTEDRTALREEPDTEFVEYVLGIIRKNHMED